MVQIRWGNSESEAVPPGKEVEEFVNCLSGFSPRIVEISAKRIALEPFNGRYGEKAPPIIFECSADEMTALGEIAEWYIQARNHPVFTTIKNPTEYSAGISQAQLCAN